MTGEIIGEATVKGDKAEVWTDFNFIGKIYPTGKFSRSLGGSPPVKGPLSSTRKYTLTLTGQHFGATAQQNKGPQWKIDEFEPNSMVTVDVAIHYLEQLRNKSNSQSFKKNAEQAIRELSALRKE